MAARQIRVNKGPNVDVWYDTKEPGSPRADTYADLPEDQDDWGCNQWKIYYDRNKAEFGAQKAKEITLIDIEKLSIWANIYYCKYQCEWIDYMKKEGFPVDNIISNLFCSIAEGTETVRSMSKAGNVVAKALIPVGLIVGVFYLFTNWKNIKKFI